MNRKQKNIQYIREKNRIRAGDKIGSSFKVATEMCSDKEFVLSYAERIQKNEINSLRNKYKLNFKLESFDFGLCLDDFMKNLTTIRMYFVVDYE